MSHSQLGQDIAVVKFYNNKRSGFFVEIGANDGVFFSNTLLLEEKYNWKGICAEPIPYIFERLCKNRPNSSCCSLAVFNESGLEVLFDIANSYDLLSGISSYTDCHKKTIDSNKKQIIVETISFNDLLEKYNAPSFIEYLSLDTEGTEYEILKNLNFTKYTFGLIDVEHNFIEPRRTQIRELLLSNGYKYLKENKWDDSYVHSSIFNQYPDHETGGTVVINTNIIPDK